MSRKATVSLRAVWATATVVCVALFTSSCTNDSPAGLEPVGGTPGLRIISGANLSDTVNAAPPSSALVVEVRDDEGFPVVGARVEFRIVAPILGENRSPIFLCPAEWFVCNSFTSIGPHIVVPTATSSDGRAAALIGYATWAGDVQIEIRVPSLSLADTAEYSVQPGNPTQVRIEPRDTALGVGASFTGRARVTDRFGNVRAEVPTLTALFPSTASVSGMTVSANALGRSAVVGSWSTAKPDTVYVNVVPSGVVAWTHSGGVRVSAFDGTLARPPVPTGSTPNWVPGTDEVIVTTGTAYNTGSLATVTAAGVLRLVNVDTTSISGLWWPDYSPDGQWIYFTSRARTSTNFQLYRTRADGSNLEALTTPQSHSDSRGTVSPDGTKLVFYSSQSPAGIRIMTIATRVITALGVRGNAPQWSPDGQSIAYIDDSSLGLFIMNDQGTGQRRVSFPGPWYGGSVDWTADGNWLVSSNHLGIMLVNVATGAELHTNLQGSLGTYLAVRR